MSIQSSINQAINLVDLLYTQTGEYKAKQEGIAEKQQTIKAVELAEQASKTAKATTERAIDPKASQAAKDIAAEAQRDKAEAYKRLFKLDPTKENLGKAIAAGDVANVMQGVADKKYKIEPHNLDKAKEANQKAADRVNAMSEQKESAKRYMMLLKEDKE